MGERKGQAVLEPAHVDRRGAPDGARHAHQIAKPVNQGPRTLWPLLDGGRPGFDLWIRKIPLEKGMAAHSSILAWRIPWTKEPGRLQSMRPQSQI